MRRRPVELIPRTPMLRSRLLVAVVTSLAIGPVVGCGGRSGSSTPVVVDGSSTVYPVSVAAQEAYSESVEGTPRITVNMTGTGGGFGRYIEGEVDIVDASRPAKPEEEDAGEGQGLRLDPLHRRPRRHHRRRQPGQRLRRRPDRRPAPRPLRARQHGQVLEGPGPRLAGQGDRPLHAGRRLGDLRLLPRGPRAGAASARRVSSRAPTTTSWSTGSPATTAPSATSASPTTSRTRTS